MQSMLEAGGVEPLTDAVRKADENNPKGYFEYERVKALKDGDTAWLELAEGKSVKIISWLLKFIPERYDYQILFMKRDMNEILASQKKMLIDRGEPTDKVSDDELAQLYTNHLNDIDKWMTEQKNIRFLYVDYNNMLKDPTPAIKSIGKIFDDQLDAGKMAQVIDPNLYRQKNP